MSVLFISYRRLDTAGHVGALFDALVQTYPRSQIFLDTTQLNAGALWRSDIESSIKKAVVVLCVIGQHWDVKSLWNVNDILRLEISTAISANRAILPILFDGAKLPFPHDLPEQCRGLLNYQALVFDPTDHELYRDKLTRLPTTINRIFTDLYKDGKSFAVCRIAFEKPQWIKENGTFKVYIDGIEAKSFDTSKANEHWVTACIGWHDIMLKHYYYQVQRTGAAGYKYDLVKSWRKFIEPGDYVVKLSSKTWPWPLNFIGTWEAEDICKK